MPAQVKAGVEPLRETATPLRDAPGSSGFTSSPAVPAGGTGTVTSIAAGDGLTAAPSPITGTGTIGLQNRFADSLLLMGG
jgi:hypothetical protein